jgi:hypothetical protein
MAFRAIVTHEAGYAGLVDAFRARAHQRRIAITSDNVAAVSGLPSFYVAKLLSAHPVRRVGMISLGPLLAVLSLKIILTEDKEALAKFGPQLGSRNESCAHDNAVIHFAFTRRHMQKLGQKGMKVRWRAARKRKRAAQKAARARWARSGATSAAGGIGNAGARNGSGR